MRIKTLALALVVCAAASQLGGCLAISATTAVVGAGATVAGAAVKGTRAAVGAVIPGND